MTFSIKVPIFQKQIRDHQKYKDQILSLIQIHSLGYIKKGSVVDIISDYDLPRDHPRPYLRLVTDRVMDCLLDFKDISDYSGDLTKQISDTCKNKEYGNGLLFSQLDKSHKECCQAENALIVSNQGLHLPNEKILPFTNEQPPTKMALLVLSAMVNEQPLHFECPECD